MKTYKEFSQISIGDSDVACLILAGCGEEGVCTSVLNYGEDGEYYAYIVDEPDVEIGSHYRLVAEFSSWMRIYDDDEMIARFDGDKIRVYRAGDFGTIIHIIK